MSELLKTIITENINSLQPTEEERFIVINRKRMKEQRARTKELMTFFYLPSNYLKRIGNLVIRAYAMSQDIPMKEVRRLIKEMNNEFQCVPSDIKTMIRDKIDFVNEFNKVEKCRSYFSNEHVRYLLYYNGKPK